MAMVAAVARQSVVRYRLMQVQDELKEGALGSGCHGMSLAESISSCLQPLAAWVHD